MKSLQNKSKVTHLIPYDGIGGVERAAASMRSVSAVCIDFKVDTVFPPSATKNPWVMWNPWYFLRTAARLLSTKPDVLIVSLWRSCAVGILVKLINPSTQLVLFLHSPNHVHAFDSLLTNVASRLACNVWADSQETLKQRLPLMHQDEMKVISFVTAHIPSLPVKSVRPIFVFWGRIHPQKDLSRALAIFAAVHAQRNDALFFVIGPDCGDLQTVQMDVHQLHLTESVQFLGGLDFDAINECAAKASFYLQTSELEGMAMSVVEAMQFGLVPVVTPVGEIFHYTCHGENAIVVQSNDDAVVDILSLLNDNRRYQEMSQRAVATWSEYPLYGDSVLVACREILGSSKKKG